MRQEAKTISEYISTFPAYTGAILQEIRQVIQHTAPEAVETINYKIPTFVLNKKLSARNGIMFAGFRHHIGFYPRPDAIKTFKDEFLKMGLKFEKGSVRFPLNKPIPFDLIKRIVEFRRKEYL